MVSLFHIFFSDRGCRSSDGAGLLNKACARTEKGGNTAALVLLIGVVGGSGIDADQKTSSFEFRGIDGGGNALAVGSRGPNRSN